MPNLSSRFATFASLQEAPLRPGVVVALRRAAAHHPPVAAHHPPAAHAVAVLEGQTRRLRPQPPPRQPPLSPATLLIKHGPMQESSQRRFRATLAPPCTPSAREGHGWVSARARLEPHARESRSTPRLRSSPSHRGGGGGDTWLRGSGGRTLGAVSARAEPMAAVSPLV